MVSRKLKKAMPKNRRSSDTVDIRSYSDFSREVTQRFLVDPFNDRFPTLKNSRFAKKWIKIRLSPHLSQSEKNMARIEVLQQAFYAVKNPKEKREIIREIRYLTRQVGFSNDNLTKFSKRKTP